MAEKTSQKDLTNADKSARLSQKVMAEVAALGYGTMVVKYTAHNGEVVEAEIITLRKKIRG